MQELDRETIVFCVKQVAPLDAEMIGDATLNRIIDGTRFQTLDDGHFIDPGQSIGLISGIVTLVQALLATGFWVNSKLAEKRLAKEQEKQSVTESVRATLVGDEKIQRLLTSHPELISQLFDLLNQVEHTAEQTSD